MHCAKDSRFILQLAGLAFCEAQYFFLLHLPNRLAHEDLLMYSFVSFVSFYNLCMYRHVQFVNIHHATK